MNRCDGHAVARTILVCFVIFYRKKVGEFRELTISSLCCLYVCARSFEILFDVGWLPSETRALDVLGGRLHSPAWEAKFTTARCSF